MAEVCKNKVRILPCNERSGSIITIINLDSVKTPSFQHFSESGIHAVLEKLKKMQLIEQCQIMDYLMGFQAK